MIIDGKKFAQELRNEIKKEIESIKKTRNTTPGLTVVLVGNHTPSEIYVRNKELSAKEVGITSEVIRLESSITQEKLIEVIHGLNKDKKVHGILVQLPLPPHINGSKIIEEIDPKKDVDGFHPVNVGNLSSGKDSLVPCTPLGSYLLIKNVQKNLTGLEALIIGRSNLNGKPMAQLLLKEDCTVTIGHSKTKNLKELCQKADIVVAAVGRANLVKGDWVKEGAIVIDVGITRTSQGLLGDVDPQVALTASVFAPMPGGVGPMTRAMLLANLIEFAK